MEDYYNFTLIMFFGFLVIYFIHPEPELFYRNKKLTICNKDNKNICIEEFQN
jgi:hypothetical protein